MVELWAEEVDIIGKAAGISAEGLLDVMIASRQHRCENYLSSLFEFGCRSRLDHRRIKPPVYQTRARVSGSRLSYLRNLADPLLAP